MRAAALLGFLIGCSTSIPPPPDRAAFDKMSVEDKCRATLPVGARCANELVDAELATLMPDAKAPGDRVSGAEAEKVYLADCFGNVGDEGARAAYACWDKASDCTAFAACVTAATKSR